MEIAIIITVVLLIVLAVAISSGSSKAEKKKAEQQRHELLRKEVADKAEQLRLASERQAQRDKDAEIRRLKEVADQKKREEEKVRQDKQQRLDAQRQAEERQRLQVAEQQRQAERQTLAAQRQAEERRQQQAADQQRQRNLCENGTSYCSSIQASYNGAPSNFGFAAIKSLSRNHGVWDELDNGVAQLDSYEQLSQYIFSYGAMHQAKLKQAFESIFSANHFPLTGQTIEVIDYGCGQGIGTVCFLDYIKAYTNRNCTISNVRLIEPSEFALRRASLHVRFALRSISNAESVFSVHKELDQITESDLHTDISRIKMHIFSNILDVEDFSIQNLQQKILATQSGLNFFICVSPNFFTDGNHSRNQRLDRFQQLFANCGAMTSISNRQSDIANPRLDGKPWKRYERVFKIQLGQQQPVAAVNPVNLNTTAWAQQSDDLPF